LEKYLSTLRYTQTELISKQTSTIFRNFYPSVGFEKVTLDSNYNIMVVRHGKEYEASRLSGGEQAACAFALRLAMAQQLINIGLFILDEPTDSLDEEHRDELVDLLKSKIPIGQILIVSHYEKMVECANNVLRVQYTGRKSTITQESN